MTTTNEQVTVGDAPFQVPGFETRLLVENTMAVTPYETGRSFPVETVAYSHRSASDIPDTERWREMQLDDLGAYVASKAAEKSASLVFISEPRYRQPQWVETDPETGESVTMTNYQCYCYAAFVS